jgi:hypothetical protein
MSYRHEKVSDLAGNTINPNPPWALKELGLALTKDPATKRLVQLYIGNTLFLHYPNDPYALGKVEWGDPYDGGDGSARYAISSPRIRNCRYSSGRSQFYMRVTDACRKAVKIVKENLTPLTMEELGSISLYSVSQQLSEVLGESQQKADQIADDIFGATYVPRRAGNLMREIRHLLDIDHNFLDVSLQQQFTDYFQLKGEHEELKSEVKDQTVTFVYVRDRLGKQVYDAMQTSDISHYTRKMLPETIQNYNDDTLPDDLRGKLGVITTLDVGQFVDGVGMRTDERLFYVVTQT